MQPQRRIPCDHLYDADLTYADLSGAYLSGAILDGANLSNVNWFNTTYPDLSNSDDDGDGFTCLNNLIYPSP